jgi:hypothetical protein
MKHPSRHRCDKEEMKNPSFGSHRYLHQHGTDRPKILDRAWRTGFGP